MADSRYVLMHKNTPVADLQLDTDTGVIRSVGHVYNAVSYTHLTLPTICSV